MARLGDTLRERRMQLGVSLDQAEAGTRIRARMLEALENGDYTALPDPGYVRGYISSYARYLELDPLPLHAMYRSESGTGRPKHIELPSADVAVARTGEQHEVPWRAALAVVAIVAVVSLVAWGVVRFMRGPETPPPVPLTPTEETSTPSGEATTPIETPTETETPSSEQETTSETEVAPFTLEVTIADNGASWLEITVDGRSAYVGKLTGGQSKQFEVAESASIVVGKPEDVTITRDGVPVAIKGTRVNLEAESADR